MLLRSGAERYSDVRQEGKEENNEQEHDNDHNY
jgi:hypothetical protein